MGRSISDSQILTAALDVIMQKGYAGATTREIAAAAGINEVTLFRRFGSKKKLLMAAVEREAEDFNVAAIGYTGDLGADLTAVVQFYYDMAQTRGRFVAMVMTEMQRQPELMDIMETPLSIIGRVTQMLAQYQAEGALADEPLMETFVALIGPVFMGAMVAFVVPALEERPFSAQAYVHQFLHGRAVS